MATYAVRARQGVFIRQGYDFVNNYNKSMSALPNSRLDYCLFRDTLLNPAPLDWIVEQGGAAGHSREGAIE